jgi:transketolase C-terminal domain/subunit
MRGIFLEKLHSKMKEDPTLFFLTADMGINLVEKFEEDFPDRYLNVGIAEQNLIGVAAGLAESGMRPYVYTISNFLIHRCFEQIRNDVVLHNLPVTLVGTSTGYDNGPLGPTHHMLEDWGVVSNLTGIEIYAPFNKVSANEVFDLIYKSKKPTYVRIAKGSGLERYPEFNKSCDTLVLSYGSASKFAMEYARIRKWDFLVIDILGLGSFPKLNEFCRDYKDIIVIEDHFPHTGMYSYIAQWVTQNKLSISIDKISPVDYSLKVGIDFNSFI